MRQKVSAIPIIAGPAACSLFASPRLWNKAQTLILLRRHVDDAGVEALPGRLYVRLFNQLDGCPSVDPPRAAPIQNLQASFIPIFDEPLVSRRIRSSTRRWSKFCLAVMMAAVRKSAPLIHRSHIFYFCPPTPPVLSHYPLWTRRSPWRNLGSQAVAPQRARGGAGCPPSVCVTCQTPWRWRRRRISRGCDSLRPWLCFSTRRVFSFWLKNGRKTVSAH